MTGPELGFLVLGLVLGASLGMAVSTFRRVRPRSAGEVRVTVTTDAIPRRSATLSDPAAVTGASAARGGPADHIARFESTSPDRTPVRAGATDASPLGGTGAGLVAVPMGAGVDPLLEALQAARLRPGLAPAAVGVAQASAERQADVPRPVGAESRPMAATAPPPLDPIDAREPRSPGTMDRATAHGDSGPGGEAGVGEPTATSGTGAASGPCADLRLVADERCEVASRARQEAQRAQDTLRAAQRSYDDHHTAAEAAAQLADPRSVRAAKDAAHQAFRVARSRATSADAVDEAARDWLLEVNRINGEARAAATDATRQQEAARGLVASLDRLTVEADAARIAAEAADEACLVARQAAADCDEAQVAPVAALPAVASGAPAPSWLDTSPDGEELPAALRAGTAPAIFRLLEGDRETLGEVVAQLAGDDPEQRRAWQLEISNLVDAILGTAIEGAALEFPEDHPFWGVFTTTQARDIVGALSSLGYRFDGLGGWQEGRVPSQRDLSLALGYAGMDPMRIRHWPTELEMAQLLEPVRVAAPEYLAVAAGDLTLGELVTMLGPRADGLTEVWNGWGRIRPLLLEER